MNVLFNCSTNVVGGGAKNAAIFIRHALNRPQERFSFALSGQVKSILDSWHIESDELHLFDASPARCPRARKRLSSLARDLGVDMVYTMAGPAYTSFDATHVMGISNPFITHADRQAVFLGATPVKMFLRILQISYQMGHARRADAWIFQTKEARDGFCRRLRVGRERTVVVPNAIDGDFASYFDSRPVEAINPANSEVNIFCPGLPYLHKALQLVPAIAAEVQAVLRGSVGCRFVLTIDENTDLWGNIHKECVQLGVENIVTTIGSYRYSDAPAAYEKADVVFIPSILETFSASYLEAFAAKIPLVAADKGFARDICGDAAVYVDPFDAPGAASELVRLIRDGDRQLDLIKKGLDVVETYGDQESRFGKILKTLKECNVGMGRA